MKAPPLLHTHAWFWWLDGTTHQLLHLPRSFHRDPADRLIVATARVLDLAVLTDDGPIPRSGLVRLWRP